LILTGCKSPAVTSTSTTTSTATVTVTTSTTTSVVAATSTTTTTTTITTTPVTTTTTKTTAATTQAKLFQAGSPVSVFTDEDIEKLGIDLSGSPSEIADAIRRWQEENMLYGPHGEDFSDAIRWNYFLPGIFTSRDIINEHVDNGKVYGICFDFAVVYCSVAQYYGLECRIRNSISKPSDTDPTILYTTGMSPNEYDRLNVKLQKLGLRYDYEAVRLVAEETPAHYWAEVKINGVWVIQDATQFFVDGSNTQSTFVDSGDNEVTDWLSCDKSDLLDEYQRKLDNGERLPES
ncbi:MAG: hypothetical protein JW856_00630, partial [Dehalococcoidales bacterium]|nr:hypothetical protein [Dehalococcoidales bacterium]